MRILVTGGAGFIASHITDAYIAAGHDVVVLDNLSTGDRRHVHAKAEFVEGDITDQELIASLFARYRFDVINHHAAQLDVRRSVADPMYDATVNILGTLNLLEAARIQSGLQRFIFASSGGAVYGEQDYFPADENHPTRPMSPYGVTKRTTELYLHYYQTVFGIPYTSFRYTNVYGPRQRSDGEAGVVAIFAKRLLQSETCVINGDGEQTRDYVFVGDVVHAHVLALQSDAAPASIYNVCTGIETTVNAVFAQLSNEITHGVATASHGAAKAGEQLRSVCSGERISRSMGWKPMVSLADGLTATAAYFRDNVQRVG